MIKVIFVCILTEPEKYRTLKVLSVRYRMLIIVYNLRVHGYSSYVVQEMCAVF